MTSFVSESNMLAIPEQMAKELGLHSGSAVEIKRTAGGFEVTPVSPAPGMRRGASGVWRTHEERIAILENLCGEGRRLGITGGVEEFLRMRDEEDALDREDE